MPWERGRFLCFTLIITCILLALTLQMEICTYIFTKCLQNYEIKYPCNFWIDQSFLRGSFEDTFFFFYFDFETISFCLFILLSFRMSETCGHACEVSPKIQPCTSLSLSLCAQHVFSLCALHVLKQYPLLLRKIIVS